MLARGSLFIDPLGCLSLNLPLQGASFRFKMEDLDILPWTVIICKSSLVLMKNISGVETLNTGVASCFHFLDLYHYLCNLRLNAVFILILHVDFQREICPESMNNPVKLNKCPRTNLNLTFYGRRESGIRKQAFTFQQRTIHRTIWKKRSVSRSTSGDWINPIYSSHFFGSQAIRFKKYREVI